MGDAAVVMVVDELEKMGALGIGVATQPGFTVALGAYAEEALAFHTAGSAWMMFDEKSRGTIEPGKAADFVVLGEDILHVDPDRIPQIPIERTIVAGKEIFTRRPAAATSSPGGMR